MDQVTKDVQLALEIAERFLNEGERVKIHVAKSDTVYLTVYESGLPIMRQLIREGQTFMGVIHT